MKRTIQRILPNVSTKEARKAAFEDIKQSLENHRSGAIGCYDQMCKVEKTLRTFNKIETL